MLLLAILVGTPAQDTARLPGSDREIVMTADPKQSCEASGDEITVCGRRDPDAFRLPKMGPRLQEKPLRPNFRIAGGEGKVEAVQRGVGGVSVPSLMATLKFSFGKKKKKPAADAPE